jgi:hypothetical protein
MSGGRCEFPGCNKKLWEDGLTLKSDNFAQMAHNIPSSPKGPRGEEKHSRSNLNSFDNILLVCAEHHKLFDGDNKSDYSVAQLSEYKRKHEDRIEILTSIKEEKKSSIIRLHSSIGTAFSKISYSDATSAIVPDNYPSDHHGCDLDLKVLSQTNTESYWETMAHEIAKVKTYIDSNKPEHLSIFGLAPVAALVLFGKTIGNIYPNTVYQKQRIGNSWKWPKTKIETGFKYNILTPSKFTKEKDVAIVISLSGTINTEEVKEVGDWKGIYQINIDQPSPYFIDSEEKLKEFRKEYRMLLSKIVTEHGQQINIHLFLAVPNSIAIACGQEILPKADPVIYAYEYVSVDKKFIKALKIN